MTFEQIYKQALAQGKTGNMTLKEFKKKMKELGYTANSKNARAYFYREENKNIPVEKRSLEVKILTPTQFNGKIGNSGVQEGMVIGGPNMNFDLALNLATSLGLKTFTYANDGKLKMTWNHPNARKAIKKYEAPNIDENKFRAPLVPLFPLSYYDLMVLEGKVEPNNFQFETLYKKQGGKMTLKFQQGGQVSSLDAVMQFVQALAQTLQADPNQVILAAQLNPEALKSAVQVYQQTLDIQQAAQAFTQALQSQAQAAKHGAKLNYLKTLKNQCADDEELVYFKKGGKVDCGCRKKDGGEIKEEKKESAIDKFKKMARGDRFPINKNDTIHTTTGPKRLVDKKETMKYPKFDHTKATQAEKDRASEKDYYRGDKDHGDHDPVKKDCGGSKMKLKKGDKVCPKCGKVHAAGAGCMLSSVKKFKMHRLGGSLNGVPFMLQGTSKGGVQYRFRRSTNDMNNGYKTYSDLIMMTLDPLGRPTYDTPPISAGRIIYVTPLGNDTIFYTNNDYIFNKTPKGDLNLKKAKLKFYQLIKKSPIEGEEYRMTPYWNSNHINLDMVRNRALKGN